MAITLLNALMNAGSKLANVNGTTPKTFTYTMTADGLINSISCILKDDGTTSLTNFGAIAAISNGVLIQATQSGSNRTIATIKDNADFSLAFNANQYGNGSVLSILGIITAQGFGNSNNIFVGTRIFQIPIQMFSGDSISVVIQDNLSAIDVLQFLVEATID